MSERRVVGPGFYQRVYQVVRTVPPGWVTTYGDVASVLGSPRAARQVGFSLARLTESDADVPWQRVINARGAISHRGDTIRAELQRRLLELEGLVFDDAGRVDLRRHRWRYPDLMDHAPPRPAG